MHIMASESEAMFLSNNEIVLLQSGIDCHKLDVSIKVKRLRSYYQAHIHMNDDTEHNF